MSEHDLLGIDGDALDLIQRAADTNVDETQWAPLLVDMLRVLEALNKRCGLPDPAAFAAAQANVLALAEYFGGRMVYLPKGDRLRIALRDAEMWRAFTGKNVPTLAQEYDISEIHCYAVLKKQRALHQHKLQGRLFEA
jgi:Mor family transcriptional regulator